MLNLAHENLMRRDHCVVKSEVIKHFNTVISQLDDKKFIVVLEKKEPAAVLLDVEEYTELLNIKAYSEQLRDALAIEKARTGTRHSLDKINSLLEAAGMDTI